MKAVKVCKYTKCDSRHFALGMCEKHYNAYYAFPEAIRCLECGYKLSGPVCNKCTLFCVIPDCSNSPIRQGLCDKHAAPMNNYRVSREDTIIWWTVPKLCVICKKAPAFNIDHCHAEDHVRGGLCRRCNTLLGYLESDEDTIKAAFAYLEQDKAQPGKFWREQMGGGYNSTDTEFNDGGLA